MIKNIGIDAPWHLFKFNFQSLLKNLRSFGNAIYFGLVILIIFRISYGNDNLNIYSSLGVTVTAIVLSLILISSSFIEMDMKDGLFDLIYLSGLNLYWYIIVKLTVLIIAALTIALSIMTFSSIIFGWDFFTLIKILLATLIAIPAYSAVILFISLVTHNYSNNIASYILSLPFMIPIIIFMIGSVEIEWFYLVMSLGLDLIYLPIFIYLSRQTLEFI